MKNVAELIDELKRKESFVLAIDGMCGSGKSTLALKLKEELDCLVFHMDDFYLPPNKRTEERLGQPGGNVDYERFLETVLRPLSLKQDVHYQPFDCSTMKFAKVQIYPYHQRIVIEGSYSLRPELTPYYTNMIALKISPQLQNKRLKERNPHQFHDFQEKWIPLENQYFEYYQIFKVFPSIHIKD